MCKSSFEHYNTIWGGMIIFDNSDWYPRSIEFLRNNLNWIEVDFHGFGPINDYSWTTTIFIKPSFRLAYKSKLTSKIPINSVAEDDLA